MALFSAIATAISSIGFASVTAASVGSFLVRTVLGIGLSLLQQKLAGKKLDDAQSFGVRVALDRGADVPQSFIFGKYATAGTLQYGNTAEGHSPNALLYQVVTLSDIPVTGLAGVWVNGVKRELMPPGADGYQAVRGFQTNDGQSSNSPGNHLKIKFYDGTQTTADANLVSRFSGAGDRAWTANAIGKGTAYAIVQAYVSEDFFTSGFPKILYEIEGVKLYNIAKDSSVGGSGTHRWNNPATWEFTENVAVVSYNILRGIEYDGAWFYGLQGVTAAQLPAAHWIDQVNKCDATVTGADGPEPRYRASGEIPVTASPADVIPALMTACNGRLADVGGAFKLFVGGAGTSVASFTDDDVVSTEEQTFTPFMGLSDTVNGVTGKYPSPKAGWQTEVAPPIYRPDLEASDGGRRLLVSVPFDFVPYPEQVQRLMKAALNEARRARRHTLVMPPKFWAIEPGDVIEWTSERNGYIGKKFRVDGVVDLPGSDVILDITEIDPSDYDFNTATDFTPPNNITLLPSIIPSQSVPGFTLSAATIKDGSGADRRPAILAQWSTNLDDVRAIRIQVRVKATGVRVPDVRIGSPEDGQGIISDGILGATEYEGRARFVTLKHRPLEWTAWQSVTTGDVKFTPADFGPASINWSALGQDVKDQIDGTGSAIGAEAQAAALAAQIAQAAAEAAEGGAVAAQSVAVEARDVTVDAIRATMPSVAAVPPEAWATNVAATGAFPRAALAPARVVEGDADFGTCYESDATNQTFGPATALPFDRSRSYLVTIRMKTTYNGSTGGCSVRAGFNTFSSNGTVAHEQNTQTELSSQLNVAAGVTEFVLLIHPNTAVLGTFSGYTHTIAHTATSDPASVINFHVRSNYAGATDAVVRVGLFEVKDITDVLASNVSAAASVTASQAALVYKNDAGDHAAAASSAKVAAQTAKAAALVSENAAAISASNADDAAAGAVFARDVAARVMGGGGGNPNPIFIDPAGSPGDLPDYYSWTRYGGSSMSRKASGGKYGACIEYSPGPDLTGNYPALEQISSDVGGLIASDVLAVEIDFEVEMISGTWGSAAIRVHWVSGTGGTGKTADIMLGDVITSRNGKIQSVQAMVERPDGYVAGDANYLRVAFLGVITGASQSATNHTARIHRFDYRVVSQSASALISQKAITDLKGNAESALVFRAKAGTSDGSMVIGAWDKSDGPGGSKIKLTGGEIELNGKVVASGQWIGSNVFTASYGWRIWEDGTHKFRGAEISGRQLEVASGTVSFPTFTPTNSGGPLLDIGWTDDVMATGEALTEWAGADATYMALVEHLSGSVTARNTGVLPEVYWGFEAVVLPLTKWSGNQTIRLRINYWCKNVLSQAAGSYKWKLYKVT